LLRSRRRLTKKKSNLRKTPTRKMTSKRRQRKPRRLSRKSRRKQSKSLRRLFKNKNQLLEELLTSSVKLLLNIFRMEMKSQKTELPSKVKLTSKLRSLTFLSRLSTLHLNQDLLPREEKTLRSKTPLRKSNKSLIPPPTVPLPLSQAAL
jgi:hypothetical protein